MDWLSLEFNYSGLNIMNKNSISLQFTYNLLINDDCNMYKNFRLGSTVELRLKNKNKL